MTYKEGYGFIKLQDKLIHLMDMDNIKIFSQNDIQLGILIQTNLIFD